jgi:hypothetical protein
LSETILVGDYSRVSRERIESVKKFWGWFILQVVLAKINQPQNFLSYNFLHPLAKVYDVK